MSTSFLVVDDHPLFREALQLAISAAFPDADIVEASSVSEARSAIESRGGMDLVLLDLCMPGTRGFDGLIELRALFPKVPVVVVSALADNRVIHEAMTCGASGFISKASRKGELGAAIGEVLAGAVILPPGYEPPPPQTGETVDVAKRCATLTPQQHRVLQLLRQGKLNKQIAHELDVGETTVKAHVSEILRKLNVASRTQAVIEASKVDLDRLRPQGAPFGPV